MSQYFISSSKSRNFSIGMPGEEAYHAEMELEYHGDNNEFQSLYAEAEELTIEPGIRYMVSKKSRLSIIEKMNDDKDFSENPIVETLEYYESIKDAKDSEFYPIFKLLRKMLRDMQKRYTTETKAI